MKILKSLIIVLHRTILHIINRRKTMSIIKWQREELINNSAVPIEQEQCSLKQEQVIEVERKWKGRYQSGICWTDLYHRFYTAATGTFSPDYIPDDLYYEVIDRHFNNRIKSKVLDNKCLYAKFFSPDALPDTIAYRINGTWLDDRYRSINEQKLDEKIRLEPEVILKRANESMGGKGVFFLSGENLSSQVLELSAAITNDIVIQKIMKQHPEMARLNPQSINTIRHISLLKDGKSKVYSSIMRMGINGSRVDNASSGGITAGITESGRLKPIGFAPSGQRYDEHPSSGIKFDEIVIPSYAQSITFVQQLHESFPFSRLVSWDVAINESGKPVLIEANLYVGELDFHQLNNGPLFGADQDEILSEIDWSINDHKEIISN